MNTDLKKPLWADEGQQKDGTQSPWKHTLSCRSFLLLNTLLCGDESTAVNI